MNNFYVYAHYKPDGNIFYVGKGRGNRAWWIHKRSDFWYKTVHKYGYEVVLLYENLSEEDAFKLERDEIVFWGRRNNPDNFGFLINLTDGGEGTSGYKFTQEQLNNIDCKQRSKSAIKTMSSQDMRNRISKKMVGNTNGIGITTSEGRMSMKKVRKEQWQNTEYRQKNLAGRKKRLLNGGKGPNANKRKNLKTGEFYLSNVSYPYTVTAPDGSIHSFEFMQEFAVLYNIPRNQLTKLLIGTRSDYMGWTKYIPPDDNHLLNQFTL